MCNYDCGAENCMDCLVNEIELSVFFSIKNEEEGEIDEEWYNEKLSCIRNEDTEEFISEMMDCDCENLIYRYGIHKALKEYKDIHGDIPLDDEIDICKILLIHIVNDMLSTQYINYTVWRKTL